MEIGRFYRNAPLCNHISRHRAVDSTGEQKHRFSTDAHRQAARPRNHNRIDIDHAADFHVQHNVRIVYVHFHLRVGIQNNSAKFCINLLGVHRKIFPCSSGIYFKSLIFIRIHIIHIFEDVLRKLVKPLVLHSHHRADTHDSKNSGHGKYRILIIIIAQGVHINSPLFPCDFKFAVHRL